MEKVSIRGEKLKQTKALALVELPFFLITEQPPTTKKSSAQSKNGRIPKLSTSSKPNSPGSHQKLASQL